MKQTINLYAGEGCWLYKDEEDGSRQFLQSVTIPGADCLPYWHECTNEEKEQWEADHAPEEPEDAEVVEEPTE